MRIILATHGFMAKGIKDAIELLLGAKENIDTINAYTDEQSLEDQFMNLFEKIESDEQVLVLTDLYGGSVNQYITSKLCDYQIECIAGINLALVLEFAASTQERYEAYEIEAILMSAKEQMRYVNQEIGHQEETDFFEEG